MTTKSKLVVMVGGEITNGRTAHLRKLLELLKDEFKQITVIHEGLSPISLELTEVHVRNTGLESSYKHSSVNRLLLHIRQDIQRFRIINEVLDSYTTVIFKGIYQPLSLLFLFVMRNKNIPATSNPAHISPLKK